MEAAFVEIGLEKNGFLYVDEIVVPELEGKRHHGKKITDLIARGQQIMVQAVKDPMKTKGARLTTEISLPGRFLVFVPQGEGLGVSRRLDDAERTRLKEIIKGLDAKEGGIIVRTAAEGASAEDIERDLVFLQRLWKTIQAKAKSAKAPALVYQEAELPLRIVRDLFAGDFESALIDHDRTYKRIVGYLKKTSPHMLERVHRYKEKTPLFEGTGVDAEIRSTLNRRVDLPSGGYLIFDYAEAFTVIDVNTGRFVGSRSKTSTGRLEDTITKNNLEAVKEVVRQLRLRDIGGIIVIDFIDMANPKNRATVEEALRNELERDRTKTYVVEISPLGLVEMTRQNVTDGPREILTKKCPTCAGDGIVLSEASAALEVERRLRVLAAGSRAQAFRVEVNPRIASLLARARRRRASPRSRRRRRSASSSCRRRASTLDHSAVLAEGKLEDLQPEAPVAEGAELELKLVELGLHDAAPRSASSTASTSSSAAPRSSSARRRRSASTASSTASPTRRCSAAAREARRADHVRERGREADARAEPCEEDRAEHEVVAEADVDEADERRADEVEERSPRSARSSPARSTRSRTTSPRTSPARRSRPRPARRRKKKTRRGSRGGRNRKKKPAGSDRRGRRRRTPLPRRRPRPSPRKPTRTSRSPASPRIHVPDFELGDAATRSRRASAARREAEARGRRGHGRGGMVEEPDAS